MLNKNNPDFRRLVKDFSILASAENIVPTLNYFIALFGVSMVCNYAFFRHIRRPGK